MVDEGYNSDATASVGDIAELTQSLSTQGFSSYTIIVHNAPPSNPIAGEYFSLQLWLLDSKGQLVRGRLTALQIVLVDNEGNMVLDSTEEMMVVTPTTGFKIGTENVNIPCIDNTGQANINVKINQVTPFNSFFQIKVQALNLVPNFNADANGASQLKNGVLIDPPNDVLYPGLACMSKPLTVLQYRLAQLSPLPSCWYRDPGGRRNCLSFTVQLQSAYKKIVHGLKVPVIARLEYEDGTLVQNQSLLVSHNLTNNLEIGESGEQSFEFRIREVSKRHGQKKFVIVISPDPAACDIPIAPCKTNAVKVLSKVNKGRQEKRRKKREEKLKQEEMKRKELISDMIEPTRASNERIKLNVELDNIEQNNASLLGWCNDVGNLIEQQIEDSVQSQKNEYVGRIDTSCARYLHPNCTHDKKRLGIPVLDEEKRLVGFVRPKLTFEFVSTNKAVKMGECSLTMLQQINNSAKEGNLKDLPMNSDYTASKRVKGLIQSQFSIDQRSDPTKIIVSDDEIDSDGDSILDDFHHAKN